MEKLWIAKHPSKVFLYPSLLCNLRCKMCYSGGHSDRKKALSEELSFNEYCELIDKLYQLGIRYYDISGGEPFLRDDIAEICKYIKQYDDTITYLVSNGTLIKQRKELVCECMQYVDLIKISVDSPNPKLHNEIRQSESAYEMTEEGISILLQEGYKNVGINFVVMDSNADDVLAMLDYSLTKGVSNISLLRFIDVSPRGTLLDENLKIQEITDLVSDVNQWIADNEEKAARSLKITLVLPGYSMFAVQKLLKRANVERKIILKVEYDPIRGCPAYGDSIVITNTGIVTGCTSMVTLKDFYVGNVKTQTLEEIYEKLEDMRKRFREREAILKNQEPCAGCEYWTACRGGCPAMAYKYYNTIMQIDPTCCKKR